MASSIWPAPTSRKLPVVLDAHLLEFRGLATGRGGGAPLKGGLQPTFEGERLLERIQQLSFEAQLAFLLSCAERLLPGYVAFRAHHHWGDVALLRQALDLAWKRLSGHALNRDERLYPQGASQEEAVFAPALLMRVQRASFRGRKARFRVTRRCASLCGCAPAIRRSDSGNQNSCSALPKPLYSNS